MLTEFVTFDEIRAVLGVSATEIEDADLVLPIYETRLTLDLEDVAAGIPAQFRAISALSPASRSTAQQRLFDVTRLFSAYAVAKHLLTALPLYAEQRLSDGRAEKERIANPFEQVSSGVQAGFSDLALRLSAAYVAVASGTANSRTARVYLSNTGLGTDPVTNA